MAKSPKTTRKHVLDILGAFGPRAVPALLSVLATTKEAAVRKSICQLLAATSEVSLPLILEAVEKPDLPWYLVRNLVGVLGEMGDPAVALKISHFARHDHPRVREETLVALHKFPGADTEQVLVQALNDKELRVVSRAIALLGSMRSRHARALDFYRHALSPESDLPDSIKAEVCKAVGLLGDLTFPDGTTSAEILGKILSAGSSGKFFGLMKSSEAMSSPVRIEASIALGRIATPRAAAILKEHLKDKDPEVRKAVENALRGAT